MNRYIIFFLIGVVVGVNGQEEPFSPQKALNRLMEGNSRYISDQLEHPNRTQERREATRSGQAPSAIIVGCSDSRVSPEVVFDEGIGDLFVVRVAGNVIGVLELESIEFAVNHLHSVLILVLGHQNCGAVKAVVDGESEGIKAIAKLIQPSLRKLDRSHYSLETAIEANALHMKELLISSPKLKKLVKEKRIGVEAAYYHLDTGVVELL
jgi:carbonic anhydrase